MDGDTRGLAALVEAEWLREMFEEFALEAVERRIAYSIDRHSIDDAMFFLEVYSFVNGGDVLQHALEPSMPVQFRRAVND